jgi:glycosyltransferase involved in cell wall biosynthesis
MDSASTAVTPHVSVVICTRNREDKVGAAITSVLANSYPTFDLTIVDQSTSDTTRQIAESISDRDDRLRYLHREEAGLSRAYNTGISNTTGEILAFTDDDCVAGPNWIESIVRALRSEPDGELLYGNVVALGEAHPDVTKTPSLAFEEPERLSRGDGFKVAGMGANFAARRSLFERVGPFDNVLGGGGPLRSSQDFDLGYRAYRRNCVTLLRPDVVMHHDGHRDEADWPSLLVAYGTGDGAFYTKHVRCFDVYALWLLSRALGIAAAKWLVKGVAGKKPTERYYVKGFLTGIRGSFRFKVDRATRLYVEQ